MPEIGLCQCGCGRATRLAPQTRSEHGWTKGEPIRFLKGHSARIHRVRRPVSEADWDVCDGGHSSPCWIWRGGYSGAGYARLRYRGRIVYAHRYMYEREHGPIGEGLHIDHLCCNRNCVNPEHMEPVTPVEHGRRGWARRRP